MTYRERRARGADRLGGWADKRKQKSTVAYTQARNEANRPQCRCCRERFTAVESDAADRDEYCSAACERGELAEPVPTGALDGKNKWVRKP
jgi:hypothetical protein